MSSQVLNMPRIRDLVTFLGNLLLCLTDLSVFFFLHAHRISCVSVCAHCLLSCHSEPLRKVWLHLPHTLPPPTTPFQIFIYTNKIPGEFSPVWTIPSCISPYIKCPDTLITFGALPWACPYCLSCTGESKTGNSTHDEVFLVLANVKISHRMRETML